MTRQLALGRLGKMNCEVPIPVSECITVIV